MNKEKISIFWFRRDIRLNDNCGLYHALNGEHAVLPIFIFDKNILNDLEDKQDARVSFIHKELEEINKQLHSKGTTLTTFYTTPKQAFKELISDYDVQAVYTNRDYEPYAKERDEEIKDLLSEKVSFNTHKDQVIFEKDEVTKDDGKPYLVYTPYSKRWLSKATDKDFESYSSALRFDNWYQKKNENIISLSEMGFEKSKIEIPTKNLTEHTLDIYAEERDYPAKDSTSRLGLHLRFGTVSVREIARQARDHKDNTYLKELIWREFFMCILDHFPEVIENNFNSKYDTLKWRNNKEDFEKWKEGKTGYPLVDAGMRELNETGFMHNRVRMLVASFLTKHLLIDWKWGEAYFAEKLLDYELSSNNGNWQWAAGTGVDAQPYFRIFNPTTHIDKFDKNKNYIKKWIKEYGTSEYPEEMVEHKEARERALEAFKSAVS